MNDASSAPVEDVARLQLVAHEALAAYMRRARITVRGLAKTLGVNRCKVDRLRRGAQKTVEAPIARRIERELGVPDGALFVAPEPTRDLCSCGSRKSPKVAA